jgi:hypothetical protein
VDDSESLASDDLVPADDTPSSGASEAVDMALATAVASAAEGSAFPGVAKLGTKFSTMTTGLCRVAVERSMACTSLLPLSLGVEPANSKDQLRHR